MIPMVVPSGHGARLSANFDCTRVLAQRDLATSHAGRLHSLPCQQLVPAAHLNLSHDLPASPALLSTADHPIFSSTSTRPHSTASQRVREDGGLMGGQSGRQEELYDG